MAIFPGSAISSGGYNIENSLRFNSADSTYLSWTPASQGNRQKWTLSLWVKRSALSTNDAGIFSADATFELINFPAEDGFQVYINNGAANLSTNHSSPSIVFRDPSAWYHLIIAWDTAQQINTERVKLYVNGAQIRPEELTNNVYPDQYAESGINNDVEHSIGRRVNTAGLYFNGYMAEVNFIDGQALDPADFGEVDASYGHWIPKEYTGTYGDNGFYLPFKPTGQASGMNTVLFTGTTDKNQQISNVGYEPDLVWLKSTSNAQNHYLIDSVRGGNSFLYSNATTAENKTRTWISDFTPNGFITNNQVISNGYDYAAWTWDAGDNQTSTGISSIAYTGNGAELKLGGFGFSPDLVIAKARSAGSPLLYDSVRGAGYLLQPNYAGAESYDLTRVSSFDSDGFSYGSFTSGTNVSGTEYVAWGWDAGDGDPVTNTDGTITSTVKANDATGFSIVSWTGNGTDGATVGHGLSSAPEFSIIKNRDGSTNWDVTFDGISGGTSLNLDTTAAVFSPTQGYHQLGATTLTLKNGGSGITRVNTNTEDYIAYCFKSVSGVSDIGTYTGTGSSGNAITGLGFKPGFVMIKRTDDTAEWIIVDSTRSPFNSANDILGIDGLAESSYGTTNRNIDFDSDGFTIQSTSAGGTTALNASGGTYLYMAFKGSYSDYVAPLNTDGSIDSRVKANTEKGFSVVSYTGNATSGATVGHGLSSAPEMVILKSRTLATNWYVWHEGLTQPDYQVYLNLTSGQDATGITAFNDKAPTNSVIELPATGYGSNNNSEKYVAYCFHSVAGYSDIGSYTGNGSTTGPVVTTGFRPAFVLLKASTRATGWIMVDNTRDPDNFASEYLYADTDSAEATYTNILEFTDTGFELRIAGGASNVNGDTYIYMAFADTRDYQWNHDASGNLNNWTPNNINSNAPSESNYALMTDVPTLTDEDTSNFATWNPLDIVSTSYIPTYSEGNLKVSHGTRTYAYTTLGLPSGKWYAEVELDTHGSGLPTIGFAVRDSSGTLKYTNYISNGNKIVNGTSTSYGSSYTAGDIIGISFDADTGDVTFYKNGVSQGSISNSDLAASTTNNVPARIFAGHSGSLAANATWILNAGQRPFKYTPPTGFLKMNTYNLPDPAVKPQKNFSAVTYSGSSAEKSITGLGFQPDMTWIKNRNTTASHNLADAVRGATKRLYPDLNYAETTYPAGSGFVSFDSDGFTVDVGLAVGTSGYNYAAWNWLADNTSGSANENGGISSTVAANPDAGFSIVTWTGSGSATTVGHGLSSAPDFIFLKNRDTSINDWIVYHSSVGATKFLRLNQTNATTTQTDIFNNTEPTSSVFSIGTNSAVNSSSVNYVAYCFHSVDGYSKFGSYTGNNSTNGPFIYTGFRPAWVFFKCTTSASTVWLQLDSVRNTYNVVDQSLRFDSSAAEPYDTASDVDFVGNGIKIRSGSSSWINFNTGTYIYGAFAEYPFKYTNARGTSFDKYSDPTQSALTIGQSARFSGTYNSAPAYLSRSVATAGNRKTWTYSTWIKIAESAQLYPDTMPIFSTGSSSSYHIQCRLVSGYQIQVYATWGGSDAISVATGDNTKLRDFAGWYHLVVSYDTTQPTAANRVKLFLNGSLLTDLSQTTYPSQNVEYSMNYNPIYVGGYLTYGSYGDHYQAETNLIDGQALGPESFGYKDTTTGQWLPRSYDDFNTEVDYGQNGFRLDYQSGAIGTDRSGNNNDLTATGMSSVNDVTLDSPSNNFCVFNPLEPTYAKFSEGDLTISSMTATNSKAVGTIYVDIEDSEGYYFEVRIGTNGTTHGSTGISKRENVNIPYSSTLGAVSITASGSVYLNGTQEVSGLTTFSVGDIISIYFKSGNLYYAINGTAVNSGNPVLTGLTGYWTGAAWRASSTASPSYIFNFGQDSSFASAETRQNNQDSNSIGDFQFTVPTGFKAICTSNLPASTITNGRDYFNTVLYTGNGTAIGSGGLTVTGVGFQPDFVWGKRRDTSAYHGLVDSIRGGTKLLFSNSTDAETTYSEGVSTFDSDGFTVGNLGNFNSSGGTYAAWNWKANGSGVLNEDGTLDSTVSANTTSGFSIAAYTADGSSTQTFGHGLGVTPDFVIIKARDRAGEKWPVWHQSLATNGYISLNKVDAASTGSTIFQTAGITSSVIAIGNNASVGLSGTSYICYSFAEVEGFSKFGYYTGNGSTDGPFIYTGFKPAWILLKESSAGTEHWFIYDSARDEYNLTEARLMPNLSNAEDNVVDMGDFVSNGFKIRPTGSYINQFNRSSATIIYAAFAENPFKNSNAR